MCISTLLPSPTTNVLLQIIDILLHIKKYLVKYLAFTIEKLLVVVLLFDQHRIFFHIQRNVERGL